MADTVGIFDNTAATQRSINPSTATQTFTNTGSDLSYSLGPTDLNDYFRIQLTRSSRLLLTLSMDAANADISLIDNTGDPINGELFSSKNLGTLSDAILSDNLTAGIYYIRVNLPDTSSSTNYTLNVTTLPQVRADLLWRNYSPDNGSNGIWFMDGTQIAGVQASGYTLTDPNWKLVSINDFNGDGDDDFLWRNVSTGANGIWFLDSQTNIRSVGGLPTFVSSSWYVGGTGDFDGDGDADVFWRNAADGANAIWVMNGPLYQSAILGPPLPDPNWTLEKIADYDGDQKPDLIWRSYSGSSTGQIRLWLMNGLTVRSDITLSDRVNDTNWHIVGVGDFNADGKSDLTWRNFSSGSNSVWYMNGTQFLNSAALPAVADTNWALAGVLTKPRAVDLAGNTMPTAFNIGNLNGSGSYRDTIGTAGDSNDYYKFNLVQGGNFSLSLSGVQGNAEVWLVQDKDNNGVITDETEILNQQTVADGTASISRVLNTGNYFIVVRSQAATALPYTLNVNTIAAQQLDLFPVSLTLTQTNGSALPTSVSITSPYNLTATYSIRYTSPETAPSTYKLAFYLSRDPVIGTNDLLLREITIDSQTVNTNSNGSVTLTLPNADNQWWGGDQTYYVGVIVDPEGAVVETNETNNTFRSAINIRDTKRADLIGNGLSITQTSAQPGQAIQLTGSIRNQGNISTGASRFLVQFYLSTDEYWDGADFSIGTASFAPIASKTNVSFNSSTGLTNPQSPPPSYFTDTNIVLPSLSDWEGWSKGNGTYYVVMRIDILNQVQEGTGGDENNFNYGVLLNQYLDYRNLAITGVA